MGSGELQGGELVEVLREWHAWRGGRGSSVLLPTYLALCISPVWLFSCILYDTFYNELVNLSKCFSELCDLL